MNDLIARKEQDSVTNLTEEQLIQLLKNTLCKDATREEIIMFIMVCKKNQLDPLSRQIYMVKYGGKPVFQVSIDGLRLIAERSGLYDGQEDTVYFDKDGNKYEIWTRKEPPYAARAGVYKKNLRMPIRAIALYSEYRPQNAGLWNKMPALMISKCAEALALRKAFPNDLSGLYTKEEMEQATPDKSIEAEPKDLSAQHERNKRLAEIRLPPTSKEILYSNILKRITLLTKNGGDKKAVEWIRKTFNFHSTKDLLSLDEKSLEELNTEIYNIDEKNFVEIINKEV